MPKWKKGHTNPHICVPITNPRRNIPSDHGQQARYQLQCSALDSFYTEIQGPVFLSVGPDSKLDMLKTFDLDKPFDLHLDPSSSENPPLCKITQDGKDAIITMDFYITNETATSNAAAAASNSTPEIPPDPVKPGEIRLPSWMLYTPQAPVLDLQGKNITSTLDLVDAFHQLHFMSHRKGPTRRIFTKWQKEIPKKPKIKISN